MGGLIVLVGFKVQKGEEGGGGGGGVKSVRTLWVSQVSKLKNKLY